MISRDISSNITRKIEVRNVALPREVGGTQGVESVVDLRKRAERQGLGGSPIVRCGTLEFASSCFPPASPLCEVGPGKQKAPRRALVKCLKSLLIFGAGEGIRTLDPNLGKVVLYP